MRQGTSFDSRNAKICAVDNPKVQSSLTADATMCCSKCGARAHDPANLCSPMPLPGTDLP